MKAHYGDIGIINIIRQRLKDIELQRWLSEINKDTRKDANQGNKMRTYRLFKTTDNYKCEDYQKIGLLNPPPFLGAGMELHNAPARPSHMKEVPKQLIGNPYKVQKGPLSICIWEFPGVKYCTCTWYTHHTGLSLSFNSHVVLIFTPVANLLLYG